MLSKTTVFVAVTVALSGTVTAMFAHTFVVRTAARLAGVRLMDPGEEAKMGRAVPRRRRRRTAERNKEVDMVS